MDFARYAGHGLSWALSTALFMFGGLELDRWLGTLPLFTVVGAIVGAVAGFYSLYHHLMAESRKGKEGGGGGAGRGSGKGSQGGER